MKQQANNNNKTKQQANNNKMKQQANNNKNTSTKRKKNSPHQQGPTHKITREDTTVGPNQTLPTCLSTDLLQKPSNSSMVNQGNEKELLIMMMNEEFGESDPTRGDIYDLASGSLILGTSSSSLCYPDKANQGNSTLKADLYTMTSTSSLCYPDKANQGNSTLKADLYTMMMNEEFGESDPTRGDIYDLASGSFILERECTTCEENEEMYESDKSSQSLDGVLSSEQVGDSEISECMVKFSSNKKSPLRNIHTHSESPRNIYTHSESPEKQVDMKFSKTKPPIYSSTRPSPAIQVSRSFQAPPGKGVVTTGIQPLFIQFPKGIHFQTLPKNCDLTTVQRYYHWLVEELIMIEDGWEYFQNTEHVSQLRNTIKNLFRTLNLSNEKVLHNNTVKREYRNDKVARGICSYCLKPRIGRNCKSCQQEKNQADVKYRQGKKEQGFCPLHPGTRLTLDQCCEMCGIYKLEILAKSLTCCSVTLRCRDQVVCCQCGISMDHLLEAFGFTIHHLHYGEENTVERSFKTEYFASRFKKFGSLYYLKVEPVDVVCKSCHYLEHVKVLWKGPMSKWATCHLKVVLLLGGVCAECGVKVEELKSPSLMHVHHVNGDGYRMRKEVSELLDSDEVEVSNPVNEYKYILQNKDNQDVLAQYQNLCAGCHYMEHMNKHIKLVLNKPENALKLAKVKQCLCVKRDNSKQ